MQLPAVINYTTTLSNAISKLKFNFQVTRAYHEYVKVKKLNPFKMVVLQKKFNIQ